MSRTGKSLSTLLVLCQVLLASGTAHAEDPAAAEVLFQEGRRLLADGQVTAACEKLKESFALDAMSGTLLNLAACYEQDGKTATAWARFRNAASLAKSQGKAEQAAEANRRVKALEAQLSYVTIVVSDPVSGLEVKRNDVEVSPAVFGMEVPVDPGHVEVVASAPGYKAIRLTAEVGSHHDKQTVTIPKLVPSDKAGATDKARAADKVDVGAVGAANSPSSKSEEATKKEPEAEGADQQIEEPSRRVDADRLKATSNGPGALPWIIGGLGVAAAATGGVFGFLAMRSDEDANNRCPTRVGCSKATLAAADNRDTQAMVANIGVGVGLAGIATSVVWLLVDRPKRQADDSAAVALRPVVAKDTAGVWALGRF